MADNGHPSVRGHLREWLKAIGLALGILVLLHLFVLRWVTVRHTSMYATLLPGDLVGVERWRVWTGFERGDIVVFRDPVQDDRSLSARQLLVKRLVGLPGDTVQLKAGALFVNGKEIAPAQGESHRHLVRLRGTADPEALRQQLQLPLAFFPPGRSTLELPLSKVQADSLRERKDIVSVEPMGPSTGAPGHIFPYSPNFRWNNDRFGPLTVPAKGDTLRIDVANFPLYDRLISRYEDHSPTHDGSRIVLDGEPLERYVVEQDYVFVLGDARDHSADSRYWGFVPMDHLVGRAGFVLLGQDEDGGLRSGRWFVGLGRQGD